MSKRLLLVHAHPDDESLTTGGTIAAYTLLGVEVTVVTCTLGEEGEVIGHRWAGLAAGAADQLGGYRIGELQRALSELGAGEPRFLGGAGRWRDSGMADDPSSVPHAFANGDPDEVIATLAEVIGETRPHVVVSYDPCGGYGHPDHILAHRYTSDAIIAAEADGWSVPKQYWTVSDASAMADAVARLGALPEGWRLPRSGELAGVDPETITTVIDIGHVLERKRAALRAHATQVGLAPDGQAFALSNNIAQPIMTTECYTLVRGPRGPLGTDGREHDLFGGVA